METERKGAYASLNERVAALHLGHEQLPKETRNLVTALRSPQTRGRWGEMTLRNAVEAAGMIEHCDFEEQKTVDRGRPGPAGHGGPAAGGGQVVIDSKVPLDTFLQYIEADDDDPQVLLEKHAKQLRTHVDQLAKKEYWGSSTVRRSSWWRSSRGSRCWPLRSRPTRRCRTTPSTSGSCSPRPTRSSRALRTIALVVAARDAGRERP